MLAIINYIFFPLGSGREVAVSSSGIYIDVTPPNVTEIFHTDVNWDYLQATNFQGNNHTISVFWEAHDPESLVRIGNTLCCS